MYNKIILMGRLASDPELKKTQNGVFVVRFRLAVQRQRKGANNERETDFLTCVAWRNTAEYISKYFPKGSMVLVEGSLEMREFKNSNGIQQLAYEIIVGNAGFTGEKRENSKQKKENFNDVDDDLLF